MEVNNPVVKPTIVSHKVRRNTADKEVCLFCRTFKFHDLFSEFPYLTLFLVI